VVNPVAVALSSHAIAFCDRAARHLEQARLLQLRGTPRQHNDSHELKRAERCPSVRRTRNALSAEHDLWSL
jgi:hypothetical protein